MTATEAAIEHAMAEAREANSNAMVAALKVDTEACAVETRVTTEYKLAEPLPVQGLLIGMVRVSHTSYIGWTQDDVSVYAIETRADERPDKRSAPRWRALPYGYRDSALIDALEAAMTDRPANAAIREPLLPKDFFS